MLDRDLYLPRESWIASPQRCGSAQVPEHVGFATKPQLLQAMIERALAAGVPFGWVTADEAYGDNGPLRRYLEGRQISYVLAVSRAHQITTGAGPTFLYWSRWRRRHQARARRSHYQRQQLKDR